MRENLEEELLLNYITFVSNIKVKNIIHDNDTYTIEHNNNVKVFDNYSETMLVCKKPLKINFLENNEKLVKIQINKV